MRAYQVVENGKPLEEKEIETPIPKGKEILLKTISCGVAIQTFIYTTVILIWVLI